jgi:hypothetical protein
MGVLELVGAADSRMDSPACSLVDLVDMTRGSLEGRCLVEAGVDN